LATAPDSRPNFFFIAILLGKNLFYIPYYLIIAGLISFICTFHKYAILGNDGLQLFIGPPLFRKQIEIPWRMIHHIAPQHIERSGFADAGGGRGGLPFKYKHLTVVVILTDKLPSERTMQIRGKSRLRFFTEIIKIENDGKTIVLIKPPKAGFKKFLLDLSQYARVEKIDTVSDESKFEEILLNTLIAIIVFVTIGFVLFLTYSTKS
jgi:hypothetical protein